jgi:putative transposase
MADKFQHKYRIPSARLRHWDYGWNAAYFVTICTKDRECFFGDIVETHNNASLRKPTMRPTHIGQIANDYWLQIPDHFPFVKLGNHIVMPNHVHGIIIIDKPDDGYNNDNGSIVETHNNASPNSIVPTVETHNNASLQTPSPPPPANQFGPQSQNLASIIRGYKSAVKKYATINNIDFAWQPRYHDHIIRDEQSFQNISAYIANNPDNWKTDDLNRKTNKPC